MTTIKTGLRRRIEAVNEMNHDALCVGNILENLQELAKTQVADFAAPQGFHAFEVEVFKVDVVVLGGQLMRQFKEKVMTQIIDALKDTVQMQTRLTSIVGTLLL